MRLEGRRLVLVGDLDDGRIFFFCERGLYAPDWTRRPGKGALKNWGLFAI